MKKIIITICITILTINALCSCGGSSDSGLSNTESSSSNNSSSNEDSLIGKWKEKTDLGDDRGVVFEENGVGYFYSTSEDGTVYRDDFWYTVYDTDIIIEEDNATTAATYRISDNTLTLRINNIGDVDYEEYTRIE